MIISAAKVVSELNPKYNLIENLGERELNPEGVGIDIRVGEVFKTTGSCYLGVEHRRTSGVTKVADVRDGPGSILMTPGEFILIRTMEKVNIPKEKINLDDDNVLEPSKSAFLMLDVYPRSTLQRCGIYFMGTKTDPGYSGKLIFALVNMSKFNFNLELGARVANLIFKKVEGDIARPYEGQWMGGRVSTECKTEKQT